MFTVQALSSGDVKIVANEASKAKSVTVEFAPGVTAEIGRGATDTDITFLALKNADGEVCYIYPNAAQNAIVVSGTKP